MCGAWDLARVPVILVDGDLAPLAIRRGSRGRPSLHHQVGVVAAHLRLHDLAGVHGNAAGKEPEEKHGDEALHLYSFGEPAPAYHACWHVGLTPGPHSGPDNTALELRSAIQRRSSAVGAKAGPRRKGSRFVSSMRCLLGVTCLPRALESYRVPLSFETRALRGRGTLVTRPLRKT